MPVSIGTPQKIRGTLNGSSPGTIAAAGNYADDDVISQSATDGVGVAWVFDAVVRENGSGGWIGGARITFSAQSMVAATRLWLFDANPTACELDDNAAFSLDADDRAKVVGFIDFPALTDQGEVVYADSMDLNLGFKCAAADDALYGILQFKDAETNEAASMTCDIHLHIFD